MRKSLVVVLAISEETARRYSGEKSPVLKLIAGSDREPRLRVLLGLDAGHPAWSLTNRPIQVRGMAAIAQPGLSWSKLRAEVEREGLSANQIRDLLTVFDDALGALGDSLLVCSP